MFRHVLWYFQRLLDHTYAFIQSHVYGIKVKAMLCRKGSLCNVMVHFLTAEQQDREKINKGVSHSIPSLISSQKFVLYTAVSMCVVLLNYRVTCGGSWVGPLPFTTSLSWPHGIVK